MPNLFGSNLSSTGFGITRALYIDETGVPEWGSKTKEKMSMYLI